MEDQVHRENEETLDLQDPKVSLVDQEPMVNQVQLDNLDQLDLLDK